MSIRIGAPGSIARHVQEVLERNPHHFGMKRWLVYSYASGPVPILHAAHDTQAQAESHMRAGYVLVDATAYLPRRMTA